MVGVIKKCKMANDWQPASPGVAANSGRTGPYTQKRKRALNPTAMTMPTMAGTMRCTNLADKPGVKGTRGGGGVFPDTLPFPLGAGLGDPTLKEKKTREEQKNGLQK